ncbi:aldehyde-activating protein [Stutzerimonas stutzeri]|uniref:Aldehyde-activating protein n=1 Tax=Stutzerimonas stutzeri TaxID=316 RepID=W8QZ70_STUST|nr:GFA family protein [Stutzerimonas stutzeri]AHL75594.1 aldehyde-activating protein [Stutzerimonas stutzeri]
MTQRGSCLCRRVTYEINGPLTDVLNCHCSMCRKLHAAAFRTRARIASRDWKTLSGVESIKFYESSSGEHKAFCSTCGSSLFTRFDAYPEVLGFPLGTLDTDPGVKPTRNVYVANKAPWFDITDDLPCHDQM